VEDFYPAAVEVSLQAIALHRIAIALQFIV